MNNKVIINPDAFIEGNIKNGDLFTVVGVKKKRNGGFNTNCKPGEETVFTAVEFTSEGMIGSVRTVKR